MATMIPGTTSGDTMNELIALRPGNRPRTSAREAAVPSTVASSAVMSATRMLSNVAGTQPGRAK
jgi:hypothetical protein